MRISDWSSDVCSSDLTPTTRIETGSSPCPISRIDRSPPTCWPLLWRRIMSASEIGRASCRERVCPVRVDLGGRRIIKKKKNQQREHMRKIHHEDTTNSRE